MSNVERALEYLLQEESHNILKLSVDLRLAETNLKEIQLIQITKIFCLLI
jgi:hypothetical protein